MVLLQNLVEVPVIYDPWLIEKRCRVVSRSDALKLTSKTLIEAERERLAVAEFEAVRGIQWEDDL